VLGDCLLFFSLSETGSYNTLNSNTKSKWQAKFKSFNMGI